MARRWSPALDFAVYLVARIIICIIQAVPWNWATAFADQLAWLLYHTDRRHRLVARDNLAHAYPTLDLAANDRLVRRVYQHFCRVMMEMILLPRKLRATTVDRHVHYAELGAYDRVIDLVKLGRPIILVTGHFGNWEVLSYVLGLAGYRGAVIARPLDNPWLDRFVQRFRARTGQRFLSKNGDYAAIQATLARGEGLGVLADQDAGERGLFVEFFGRPASTYKAIALLSLEYQAPILVFGAARIGEPLLYQFHVPDMIFPEEYERHPDAVRAITQRFTSALERMVRMHPDQYFWLHRRWKHQPRARKAKSAA
jgi:KDO2-lipid IV(A) lauroyltransferase